MVNNIYSTDFKALFYEKYPYCIVKSNERIPFHTSTGLRYKNYVKEYISFRKFIEAHYPGLDHFNTTLNRNVIETSLDIKYGSSKYPFLKSKGLISDVVKISIQNLLFYQDEIDITRLGKIDILEPVIVVQQMNSLVLFNGYHRATIHILSEQHTINCVLLHI